MREYNRALKQPARDLRSNMTDAEQKLWSRVRRKQLAGVQFYRQKPLGNFIVDFYAPAAKLVVEVDGSQHLAPEHKERDLIRDKFLAELGLTVLRLDNLQVLRDMDAAVERIASMIEERRNLI